MVSSRYLRRRILFLLLICLFIAACTAHFKEPAPAKGVYHRVKKGETLWRIAQSYDVNIQDLAEINNISDTGLIEAGSIIFIPGANRIADINPPVKSSQTHAGNKLSPSERYNKDKSGRNSRIKFEKKRFIWPVKGLVISKFGIQPDGMRDNGINISAREGTAVVAAASGEVIHSAPLKYFGDTIIIKHKDGYATVYAYLKDRMVKVGDKVGKGQRIALLGKPENSNSPCLHFEIRQQNKARNPLFFLP